MSIPLNRQEILREIVQDFGFDSLDIYLLPVMPLIEMMWADGKVDIAETRILVDFTNKLLKSLQRSADNEIVVSKAHAEKFIKRFLHERPSAQMLKKLRALSLSLIQTEENYSNKTDEILEYCIDIAAATVGFYPYADRERVNQNEKDILHELIEQIKTGIK